MTEEEERHLWRDYDELKERWGRENWSGWNGCLIGRPPVRASEYVEVRYRDGTALCGHASTFVWQSQPDNPLPIDIVAYRIMDGEPDDYRA